MMKYVLMAVILLSGWSATAAYAQNWVRVADNPGGDPAYVEIDADSIYKGEDGLVYFDAQDDMGVSASAINCQDRIYYVVGSGSWDWKASPYTIRPGTDTAKEADLVCSRVS
jgi:hypothetical protein